ncbi:DUF1176 domain-containing protein [Alteraurantiacibacter buctensis]|uniref:Uncharacterized protein n=1 Tax=Alteraurantiacibacter buctensis TaxID=1503981 RepID=A0A844YUF7_9SPHN|nr:DUF1176 domain-containing protein [Alteraurantiacibacter buctensis]MXO71965.1 hypothetical protein [Alteraurantiacibacter buctensis]
MAETVRQQGDWLLVCENHGHCTITGVPLPSVMPGYPRALVTIWRENRPGYPLMLAMRLINEDGSHNGTVEGLELGATPMGGSMASLRLDPTIASPHGDVIMPENAEGTIGVLADERPGLLLHGFGAVGAVPQGDLADLLERMDRAQPQVAEPIGPEIEDPPAPEPYRYTLFPRDRVDGPVTHPDFVRLCRRASYSHANGYALDHTTVPTLLVLLSCGGRDYLYTWYPSGNAPPAPLDLPRQRDPRFRRMEASFDPDLGVLTLLDHPIGSRDCGLRHRFGWVDGEGWVLLSRQTMPRCVAILPEDWPVHFMADGWGAG